MPDNFKQDNFAESFTGEDGRPKYSCFLPAVSTFYTRQLGLTKDGVTPVCSPDRIPQGFERGIQGLDFLNKKEGYFYYPWALYSAGHADMDITKTNFLKE